MRLILPAAIACVALLGPLSGAEAKPRKHVVAAKRYFEPPVIRGRSFLDSGRQVPVGSQSNYVTLSTSLNFPVYKTFATDSFGQDVLPSRFNNPGRSQPLAQFYTPAF